MSILQIKVVHTAIFGVLSACVLGSLYAAVFNHITRWTWVAVTLVCVESIVLALSGWTCPLTILAERLGANQGGVADIFLPKSLADRIFPVCGTTFVIACMVLVLRWTGIISALR